jgi:carboxyl-terminal processing protease
MDKPGAIMTVKTILYHSILLMTAIIAITPSCSKEEFGGLGIEVPTGESTVSADKPYEIVSVFIGGTGHKAGLKAGDKILNIDGRKIEGMNYDYIVNSLLRGKIGSSVLLEIERDGSRMIYSIQRGKIVLK